MCFYNGISYFRALAPDTITPWICRHGGRAVGVDPFVLEKGARVPARVVHRRSGLDLGTPF